MKVTASATRSFEHLVDAWVQKAVAHGATTFDQLLTCLPGVYPSVVFESIQRLGINGNTLDEDLSRSIAESNWQKQELNKSFHKIRLPIPHPLDYDWRFSDIAIKRLLGECLKLTDPGETVALLGTPSVLRTSIEENFPRRMILLDANQKLINSFPSSVPGAQTEKCNLLTDPLPPIEVDAVIADPPWYEEHLHGFVWAATQLCREGGHVIISIPPIGTRPSIEQDRVALFDFANELGLTLLRLEPAVLPYISPSFEINALRTEGFYGVSTEWRAGDLALLSHDRQTGLPRPQLPVAADGLWIEEGIGTVRIRIRCQNTYSFSDPTLVSIVLGDILPSVSRRDERRALIDVWTSGNRVFTCRGGNILQSILQSLASSQRPREIIEANLGRKLKAAESLLVSQAAQQITEVIRLEQDENLSLGES
jgi:hypothetical protein